jgi:hypothetical protein
MIQYNPNVAIANRQNVAAMLEYHGPSTAPEIAEVLCEQFPEMVSTKARRLLSLDPTDEDREIAAEGAIAQVTQEVIRCIYDEVHGRNRYNINRGFPINQRMIAWIEG